MSKKNKDAVVPPRELRPCSAPIIERAPLPIIEVQGTGHVVSYVNSAFCRLIGKPREELIGKAFSEIVHGGEGCVPLLDKVYETGEAATLAREDPLEPNPTYWLYAIWPALDEKEKPVGVIIQLTRLANFRPDTVAINEALLISGLRQHELADEAKKINEQLQAEIAERKHVEAALLASEEFNRSIIESSPDCIKILDLKGNLVSMFPGGQELLGIEDIKPFLNQSWIEFFNGADREAAQAAVRQAAGGGEGRFVGFFHTLRHEPKWWDVTVSPILNEEGKPRGLLAISRDVTERKKTEDALRESEERYRSLFNSIDEGFCIIEVIFDDHENPVDYCFVEVNPSFEKQSGLSDVVGRRMRDLIPNHEPHWFELYGRVARTGMPARCIKEAKGLKRWFDVFSFRMGGEQSKKVAVLFTDITERKQIEDALKDAKEQISQHAHNLEKEVVDRTVKLRDSVKSLETLTYTMAHDLRAPIRAMSGLTTALLDDIPLNEVAKDYTVRIHEAAGRMDRLVSDLLDYGQLTHLEFPLHRVDLKKEIETVLTQIHAEISTTNAEIQVMEPLPVIWGSAVLVRQILSNLISNGIKFIAPQTAPKISISAETRDDKVRIWVADNGIGIGEQYKTRIFGMFQRLHTTAEFPGTGVGLAIIKRAAERMNGTVGVESEPGNGSRFWIELPRA